MTVQQAIIILCTIYILMTLPIFYQIARLCWSFYITNREIKKMNQEITNAESTNPDTTDHS